MTEIDVDPTREVRDLQDVEDEYQQQYRFGPVSFGFDGSHLVKTLMKQDRVWIEANGTIHVIAEMHPLYQLNVLLFLERNAYDIASRAHREAPWVAQTQLYRRFKLEVMERLGVDCVDLET